MSESKRPPRESHPQQESHRSSRPPITPTSLRHTTSDHFGRASCLVDREELQNPSASPGTMTTLADKFCALDHLGTALTRDTRSSPYGHANLRKNFTGSVAVIGRGGTLIQTPHFLRETQACRVSYPSFTSTHAMQGSTYGLKFSFPTAIATCPMHSSARPRSFSGPDHG